MKYKYSQVVVVVVIEWNSDMTNTPSSSTQEWYIYKHI